MKKFILIISVIFVVMLGGCKEKIEKSPAIPTNILNESAVASVIGGETEYVLNGNAVVDLGGGAYRAVYLTNPAGKGDSVTVELTQPSDTNSVKDKYTEGYNARSQKKKVQGVGENAYIAFPSIHILEKGYLITISAGSGDTKEQLDLLVNLGQTACANLDAYLQSEE